MEKIRKAFSQPPLKIGVSQRHNFFDVLGIEIIFGEKKLKITTKNLQIFEFYRF